MWYVFFSVKYHEMTVGGDGSEDRDRDRDRDREPDRNRPSGRPDYPPGGGIYRPGKYLPFFELFVL